MLFRIYFLLCHLTTLTPRIGWAGSCGWGGSSCAVQDLFLPPFFHLLVPVNLCNKIVVPPVALYLNVNLMFTFTCRRLRAWSPLNSSCSDFRVFILSWTERHSLIHIHIDMFLIWYFQEVLPQFLIIDRNPNFDHTLGPFPKRQNFLPWHTCSEENDLIMCRKNTNQQCYVYLEAQVIKHISYATSV